MTVVDPGGIDPKMVDRVKSILMKPRETWAVIESEPASVAGLYRGYILPLAAIGPVCVMVGSLVFGYGAFGVTWRPSILGAAAMALTQYVLSLGMVFGLGLIIDALAPNFGGTRDRIQAFKVATYSMTASWVVGVFGLLPPLTILGVLGLYGLYLLWTGLPLLMKVEEDKATPYTALVIVAALVMAVVIGMITGGMTGFGRPRMADMGHVSGTVNTPAGGIDVAKLEQASKDIDAAARKARDGKIVLTDPEVLKGYLPASVAGYARSALSAETSSAAGAGGTASAEGEYQRGESRMKIQVVDLGTTGALAGLVGAFNVKTSHESDGKYEKVGKVDGRLTTETFDQASRHGEYSTVVSERFMIHAEGDGVSMDDLKAAVGAVDPRRLEGLAGRS